MTDKQTLSQIRKIIGPLKDSNIFAQADAQRKLKEIEKLAAK